MQFPHYFQTKTSYILLILATNLTPGKSNQLSISISFGTFPKDSPSDHLPAIYLTPIYEYLATRITAKILSGLTASFLKNYFGGLKKKAEIVYPFDNESIFFPPFSKTCKPFQLGTLKTDQESSKKKVTKSIS